MSQGFAALLEPEPEGGFTVTFPDIGYGATYGATWEEALRQAEDMLEEAILGMIAHNEEVPAPSSAKGRPVARLPALTAAKLELYARCVKPGSTRRYWPHGWVGLRKGHPYPRRLPRRPPRTARSRARCARPPACGDLGTGVKRRPSKRGGCSQNLSRFAWRSRYLA